MSPRNLTSIATAKSARRRDQADDAVRADPSGRLARFRTFADASVFGTNVVAAKVLAYDYADEVVDTRRFWVHQAKGDVTAGHATFAGGSLARRREAFEDLWSHGRKFVYGAMNAGGPGVALYGEFCLIETDPAGRAPLVLAVFPDDSAQRYTTPPAGVDETRAVEEATSWADRGSLATIERSAEVGDDPSTWPGLVCSDRYFEVVVVPGPETSELAEVRLRAEYRDRLRDLRAQALAGDALEDVERAEVAAYDVIRSWRRSFGTTITEVH